ncbi:MGMT family protein [Mesonia sp. K7]|uniref:MGMT family protein n=1 Tax=Mesonia sp. K7 TaxID=2218606 RepID=UPI000DA9ACF5|nr:MGMT family protein [Mesonia sp. K7]PZD77725.1 cysteine methyltransferase [Mesonia sp. K7]
MKHKSFYDKVYAIARQIPYGKVTSYGAIAKAIGSPKSARVVGYAMNNSSEKDVPAHRVVNRIGMLTGKHHFNGSNLMQQLLESEGLKVVNHQIQDFEQHFWDPQEAIKT